MNATFWAHLDTLRRALIQCLLVIACGTLISLVLHKSLLELFLRPIVNPQYIEATQAAGMQAEEIVKPGPRLVLFGPTSGILLVCKVALWSGLVMTSPFWLYILLRFTLPAFYLGERRLILPFFLSSLLFFSLGSIFAFRVTIPLANRFLYAFNSRLAENIWDLSGYLDYSLFLLGAHGIAFEGFVVLFFLVHLGLITAQQLNRWRRGAVVAIFVAAALFTPPDVLTQALLALPLLLLYEMAALYARYRTGRRSRLPRSLSRRRH